MFQYHHEIVDGIIDYVREVSGGHFRAPLKSCALVSKAWVPRSQFHLFHHVSLRFETEFKRWCKNITKERAKVLSTYVRWLSCSPPYKSKDKNSLERFTYFTHVETLRIFKVDFFKFKDEKVELQPAFGPFGNSTRYLVIDCCVGHFPALINLFRLLPNITHLDILHANLPYATIETDPNMRGHFGTIETLRMTGTERYFINMLMPERFTSLKHVSYFDRGPESAGDLRRLIGGCRKTVETLTVLSAYDLTSPGEYSLFLLPPLPTCVLLKPTTGTDVQKSTRSNRARNSAKSHSTTCTSINPIPKLSPSYLRSIPQISRLSLSSREMQTSISSVP